MSFQSEPTKSIPRAPAITASWSYVDWPAILAGSFVTLATSLLMLGFGSALGLSLVSAEPGEGVSLLWFSIITGLWFIWVVLSSIGAGAYLAGRLRHPIESADKDEVELRDGSQGLAVWAIAIVFGSIFAVNGVTSLTGAAAQATAAVGNGLTEIADGPLSALTSALVRDDTGARVSSEELLADATTILTRSVTSGVMDAADRTYLIGRIATETGQSPATVETRVDAAMVAAKDAWETAQDAIEVARRAAIITAFVIAATLAVGAAVGYFVASLGGRHRDDGIPLRSLRR